MKLQDYLKKNLVFEAAFSVMVRCSPSMLRKILNYGQRPSVDLAIRIEEATKGKVKAVDLLGLNRRAAPVKKYIKPTTEPL
jgi:hypothetical protein